MFTKTLYGKDKKGGFKVWTVRVQDVNGMIDFTIAHGKEGGKLQFQESCILKGKQGRSCYEQGVFEAESKIKSQIDKGYRENKADLEELPLLAMLAADYRKQGHRIQYPCYTSVKYDGVRCVAKCSSVGVITLESRTGQEYNLPHIATALSTVMNPGDVLDGEIYKHGYVLQDIVSAVKRTDTQAELDKVLRKMNKEPDNEEIQQELDEAVRIHNLRPTLEFHVFDMPSDQKFAVRLNLMQIYMAERVYADHPILKVTHYELAHSEEEMKAQHKAAVALGYEGIMLRNYEGLYESGKRSADLQKYKEFFDEEFIIVGHSFDKDGLIMWKLQNNLKNNQFDAKLGSDDDRKAQAIDPEKRYGTPMTLKYQARYKDTLIPQFGVGVSFRDYE